MKQALYIGNFAKPQNSAAGKRVYANALLLVNCGFNVIMIGTDYSNENKVENISKHISYISFPRYGKNTGFKYYNWLKKYITALPIKPDLIIRYGSPGLAMFDYYVYKYTRKHKVPLIVDVVDWLKVDTNNIIFKIIKSLDTWLEKAIFNRKGDGLIAISSYLYNYYSSFYRNKIIIPPLVEKYICNTAKNSIPQIIYAGSPFRKGHKINNVHIIKDRLDLIVLAFCALEAKGKEFILHIVGLTKEEYLTAFPNHRKQLKNTSQLHFYGCQSMDWVHKFMMQMDFSILLRENTQATSAGFPTKIVESMSLGIPAITTDTSDLSKYIKHGENGFFIHIDNEIVLEKELSNILNITFDNLKKIKSNIYENKIFKYIRYIETFKEFLFYIIKERNI